MQVRYIGTEDPTDNSECVVFGHTFQVGEWTDLGDATPAKLLTNPTFEVDTDGDGEAGPSVEELRAELDELGVKYHARSGASKLAEAVAQARAALSMAEAEETEGEGA